MDRRKFLTPYVRTNKRGKIVSGSLTLLKNRPRTAGFKQVLDPVVDLCSINCPPSGCGAPYFLGENYMVDGLIFSDRVNMDLDNNCNIYTCCQIVNGFPGYNTYTAYLKKSDNSNNRIWQKAVSYTITASEGPNYFVPDHFRVDAAGNSYLAAGLTVVKVSTNGLGLWGNSYDIQLLNTDDGLTYLMADINDLRITTSGKIAVTGVLYREGGGSGAEGTYIALIDPDTGNPIAAKGFFLPVADPYYAYQYGPYTLAVDNTGHIYAQLVQSYPDYLTNLIKLDENLNVIWTKWTDPSLSTWSGDLDSTNITVDSGGNIYLDEYGEGVYKVSSDGNVLWTIIPRDSVNGDYPWYSPHAAVDKDGNYHRFALQGVDNSGLNAIIHLAIDTSGDLLYQNYIQNLTGLLSGGGNWQASTYHPNTVTFQQLIYNAPSNKGGVLDLKLPLTNMGTTTVGNYVFTDSSSNVTMDSTSSTIVFSDKTINSYVGNFYLLSEGTAILVGDIPDANVEISTTILP